MLTYEEFVSKRLYKYWRISGRNPENIVMWKPYAPFERSLPSTVFVGYMNRFMETGKAETEKEIEFRSISDIQKTENEDWFRLELLYGDGWNGPAIISLQNEKNLLYFT